MTDFDEPITRVGCVLMLASAAIMVGVFVGFYYLFLWLS